MSTDKIKICPGGSYISYPIGTTKKIRMGDPSCKSCPFYKEADDGTAGCNYSKN